VIRAAAAAALLSLWALAAQADGHLRLWRIDPARSTVAFDYLFDGERRTGAFRSFEGEGAFDPDAPQATRFELRIQTGALDLGHPLLNLVATGPEWFAAAENPDARYRLVALTPLPDGRWEALGDLTIRDTLQIVRTPVTVEIADDAARATGEVEIDRTYFGVGVGLTDLIVDVGERATVRFDIRAVPVPDAEP
jgi:polyisoprenoid-binding protein YceI